MQHITPARSYRCSYHPKDGSGYPVPADTGVLPAVRVKAASAEDAQRKAHYLTGCAISAVERVEEVEVAA